MTHTVLGSTQTRDRRPFRNARSLTLALVIVALGPAAVSAQDGRFVGLIRDSVGNPVSEASVVAREARVQTRTDDRGHFRLNNLPLGALELTIRRLGFEPVEIVVQVLSQTPDTTEIVLVDNVDHLTPVTVTADGTRQRLNVEAFYLRALKGVGTYITREDILARRPSRTVDVFRGMPGILVMTGRGSTGIRFNSSSQMRGCAPMIWLDGQRAPGMEVDDVSVHDLEGIELYHGPSTTPMQFSQGPSGGSCGVVVMWTRPPPPATRRPDSER